MANYVMINHDIIILTGSPAISAVVGRLRFGSETGCYYGFTDNTPEQIQDRIQ